MSLFPELKPCPFCGSKADWLDIEYTMNRTWYMPKCTNEKCITQISVDWLEAATEFDADKLENIADKYNTRVGENKQ